MSRRDEEIPMAVRVPANVDKPDTIAFGLTGRHLSLVTLVGLGLWLLFEATRPLLPFLVFAAVAVPVAGMTAAVVLIRRHGLGLDELLMAALKQRHAPRRLVPATDGAGIPGVPTWVTAAPEALPAPLQLPAHSISLEG
ncbi:PrgI family protein, partial [Kutzneria sp. 744]|uniref:PrgI family protein n=1 Tax=Kutzneria sp. (strain 744) TaxID=345341 RepID=UPI0005BC3648